MQNLYPGKDFLQGILITKWENFQNKEVIQNISLTELENFQPSGWQFDGKKLEYIHSQLTVNDIIGPNYQNGTIDNIRFDQYTEQKCTACKKNKLVFCSYDRGCESYNQLMNYLYIDRKHVKCKIISMEYLIDSYENKSFVMPYYLNTSCYEEVKLKFPYWRHYLHDLSLTTNKLNCITNVSNYQFLLSGITPTFLEIKDYIEKIADLCKENKLQKIYFFRV